MERVKRAARLLCDNVERVLVGKRSATELAVVALLCEGHLLIEDVPGIGKTTLARALAQSVGGVFRRLQCTPDLLPSDITGVSVFDQRTAQFVFRPGPVFANVLMVDEINRATPRTQSAVLEAMQERQVSSDGVTYPLPRPFMVIATQNPIELAGTFPLPEAQLDRFMVRIALGYPDEDDERAMLASASPDILRLTVEPVIGPDEVVTLRDLCSRVRVDEDVQKYLVAITRASREAKDVRLGASPRATLDLYRAAQAWAAMQGRSFVIPDDVKRLAEPVLAHRLVISAEARLRGRSPAQVIEEVVRSVPVPVEERV